jgi:DUF1009 family protein
MSMFSPNFSGPLGLIAGQGEFPVIFAEAVSAQNKELIVFGVKGYTDPRVEKFSSSMHSVDLGSLGDLVETLKKSGVKHVVLAGGVPKREIYNSSFKMDDTAKGFIHGTGNKGDDHLLKAFGVFLKLKCGVSVVDSRHFLKNVLVAKGVLTQRKPTPEEWKDLRFGYKIAKGIGKMDIGQTVVVKSGVVLAVEAIEGTDNAVRRGGELGHGGAVVVKVAKPNQDLRFDLPCVGAQTLSVLRSVSSKVLGVESGKTIFLRKNEILEEADRQDITLVGL